MYSGVTVSVEQAKLAQERCADLLAEITVKDYRELEGKLTALCLSVMNTSVSETTDLFRQELFPA